MWSRPKALESAVSQRHISPTPRWIGSQLVEGEEKMTGEADRLAEQAARLRDTLKEQFQYDRSDLDFGIYKILNQRRDDIQRFLEEQLVPSITATIAEADIEEAEQTTLAAQVCADLARFFERYYEEGDFLPLRRYRAGTYSVPYEGEEVLLHWTNRDQYYVKNSEQLADYTFSLPDGRTVRFVVVGTDEDSQGNKPAPGDERRYTLADPAFAPSETDQLVARWVFVAKKKGVKQEDLNEDAVETILSANEADDWRHALEGPTNSEDPDSPTLLERHIREFTTKQSSDYFVHRDLGGFLRSELEAFLKTDVLRIGEIDTTSTDPLTHQLARLSAARAIGLEVIEFLDQVENFQKRLWLKRKLVLESSWLATLDLVPQDLYGEIAANDAQRAAWARDLAADELAGWSDPVSAEFLLANPGLVIDTRHFDRAFTYRLLAGVDDIDARTLGIAIDSDCFHALHLLQNRYRGEVHASYIDPPYNTGGGDFLYKDRYQHSSWLSMIRDRLALARELLAADGVQVSSIDDDEHPRLRLAFDSVYGPDNFVANVVWQKKYSPANDATWFSDDHDYLPVYARDKRAWRPAKLARTAETDKGYTNPDEDERGPWMSGDYTQAKSREERPNGWYGITRPADDKEIWPEPHAVWRFKPDEHEANVADNRVWWGEEGLNSKPRYKRFLTEVGGLVPRTVWSYEEAGHNQDAVRDLQALFGTNPFRNPKPLKLLRRILAICPGDLVLDYFAGSGTLGQAVLDERREGEAERRFILAEQGPHFDSVLRPRLAKALHSGTWKAGRPEKVEHVSGLINTMRLESYDDVLDALELDRSEQQASLLDGSDTLSREYVARYMLSAESGAATLNPAVFNSPFDAKTVATIGGERHEIGVDLPETFNYLLGLRITRVTTDVNLTAIRGVDFRGQQALVVWRDLDEVNDDALREWILNLDDEFRDETLAAVYVNGDTDLQRHRPDGERWEVRLTDAVFVELMFDETGTP